MEYAKMAQAFPHLVNKLQWIASEYDANDTFKTEKKKKRKDEVEFQLNGGARVTMRRCAVGLLLPPDQPLPCALCFFSTYHLFNSTSSIPPLYRPDPSCSCRYSRPRPTSPKTD